MNNRLKSRGLRRDFRLPIVNPPTTNPAPPPANKPTLRRAPYFIASGNWVAGSMVHCVLPEWNNFTSVTAEWTLNDTVYETMTGNNPFEVPAEDGMILGGRFTATNADGTTEFFLSGGEIKEKPRILDNAAISAPSGYVVGQTIAPVPTDWEEATLGTTAEWLIDGIPYLIADGPLVVPEMPGSTISLRCTATNDAGTTVDIAAGDVIESGSIEYSTQTVFSHVAFGAGANEGTTQTLGFKFVINAEDCEVTQIWLCKHPSDNTLATRTVGIFDMSGTLLAQGSVLLANEPESGWFAVDLDSPFHPTPGVTYKAAWLNNGWFYFEINRFNADLINGVVTIPGYPGGSNGPLGNMMYEPGPTLQAPDDSWYNAFYGGDITVRVPVTAGTRPQLSTPASISAPGGYYVGQNITATIATWLDADTTTADWYKGNTFWKTVAGNNPLTLTSAELSAVISLRCTATNEVGTEVSIATGGAVQNPGDPGFPNASNTGVPAGTTLTPSGSISTTSAGQIIENLDISGMITVNHPNVEIRNCRIRPVAGGVINWRCINVPNYTTGQPGLWVHDCELDGGGQTHDGIYGRGLFERLNIHGCENAIVNTGTWNSGFSNGCHIRRCYIHDLLNSASGDPHYDGIEMDGGSMLLEENTVDLSDFTQTAAVMIDNWFADVSTTVVRGNLLIGGGYTLYVYVHSGRPYVIPSNVVTIQNNRFKKGYWNYATIYVPIIQSGNVDHITGLPITLS